MVFVAVPARSPPPRQRPHLSVHANRGVGGSNASNGHGAEAPLFGLRGGHNMSLRYLMSNRQAQCCIVALSILTTSFALEACVTSREALLGPDTRVLPFSP